MSRYCFLCHEEYPEGTPMAMATGGTNICLPCSTTDLGKIAMRRHDPLRGYRRPDTIKTRLQIARERWARGGTRTR